MACQHSPIQHTHVKINVVHERRSHQKRAKHRVDHLVAIVIMDDDITGRRGCDNGQCTCFKNQDAKRQGSIHFFLNGFLFRQGKRSSDGMRWYWTAARTLCGA